MTQLELVKLERVEASETKALLSFAKATFLEAFEKDNSKSDMQLYLAENFTQEKIDQEYAKPSSKFYSAKLDGRWVGYLKINDSSAQTENGLSNSMEIERIYVLAEFYGQGVAQFLYNKAIRLAQESQNEYIWLGVWEENPRAIRFYQKCGFEVFDQHEFKLGNSIQNDLMMRLKLAYF